MSYGVLSLAVTSPAQSWEEPISLPEAIKFLELPDLTNAAEAASRAALLSLMITTARSVAEAEYGRDLVAKTYDLSLDYFWAQYRVMLREPLVSVDLVQYKDSTGTTTPLVANTDYIVDTARASILPGVRQVVAVVHAVAIGCGAHSLHLRLLIERHAVLARGRLAASSRDAAVALAVVHGPHSVRAGAADAGVSVHGARALCHGIAGERVLRRATRIDEDHLLNPGLLRHRLVWKRKQAPARDLPAALNSFGEPVIDSGKYEWTTVLTCNAQVKQTSGEETNADGQRQASTEYDIVQHFVAGLSAGDRIEWNDNGVTRTLDVLSHVIDRAGQRPHSRKSSRGNGRERNSWRDRQSAKEPR
jgi:head-tail adaptor